MILSQGDEPGIDARIWVWLIFAALSVIGGILGKKKKDEAEAAKRKPPQRAKAPAKRPVKPPRPPQPARPARPTGRTEVRGARPAAPPRPPTRPVRPPLAVPARPRGVEGRLGPLAGYLRALGVEVEEPATLTLEVEKESPAEKPVTTALPETRVPAAAAEPERRLASVEAQQVRRLLSEASGLRAGFIVSEILAPPVALRENRQV